MKASKLQARKPSQESKKDQRVRTGLKAGDMYMHNPPGNND